MRKLLSLLILTRVIIISNLALSQESLEKFMIQPHEVPEWGRPYSNYPVTPMASNFFENFESTYASKVSGKLIEKNRQSFQGPARGTVYYMLFSSVTRMSDVEKLARELIQGPERIFSKGQVLVIISIPHEGMVSQIQQLIQAR